jgi:hypothetical protein
MLCQFSVTKRLWKSVVCAVAKYHYHYYGVKGEDAWHLASNTRPNLMSWYSPKLLAGSDLVWCQGLRGGVRLVHSNWMLGDPNTFRKYGYITTDHEAMKEFMWVKLRARELN